MIKKETKEALIAATTITSQTEINTPKSETKILVAPLLIYGAVAITIVIGIISTVVYLGKPFQQYDYPLAESSRKFQPENNKTFTTTVVSAIPTNNSATDSNIQQSHKPEPEDSATQIARAEQTTQTRQTVFDSSETTPAPDEQSNSAVLTVVTASTPLVISNKSDVNPQKSDTISIPGYAFVIEQNKQTLQRLKQSQQRQINALRMQLSTQQSMIESSIKQIEHLHETYAASIKRHNENRQALYRKM